MPARPELEQLLAHANWVRNLALQLCADAHAAEDAAQDTLAAALQHPPREPERARGFLARTLQNVLAMSRRSERRRARRERQAAPPAETCAVDASELVARAELHRQLVAAVLALPAASRELVLRHYFEGDDVATLARRTGISSDAVRAQLRRARERLRGNLERDGGEPARAFVLLVAASREAATAGASVASAGLAASVASAAGVMTIMKLKILLGTAAAVASLWLLWSALVPAMADTAGDATAGSAAVAKADVAPGRTADADAATVIRSEASLAPATTMVVQGQLAGLHRDVRWTAALRLRVTHDADARDDYEARIAVAGDGTFALPLPAWFRDKAAVLLRIQAHDPFHLPIDFSFRPELHAREQPITVQVEPVSVVTGRVVDPRGAGVAAARVGAFLPHSDRNMGEVHMRCSTDTDAEGNYRLQVPIAVGLVLLAVPMHENSHRDDLLPASIRVTTRWGQITQVSELRLGEPAYVTGSITTGDGAPVAGVDVIWINSTADGPSLYDRTLGNLPTWADGSVGRIAYGRTDQNGRFRVPATQGKAGVCYPLDGQRRMEPFVEMVTATPPAEVGFRLAGGLATIRVLCGGLPLPGVRVMTDSIGDRLTPSDRQRQTDERGELRFLRSKRASQQVTIERPGAVATKVEIPADASPIEPFVIDLPPLPTAAVQLEFDAAFRVRQVELALRRLDAGVVSLQLSQFRNDGEGPFHLDVPPGSYELIARPPSRGERRDTFLLETRHQIDVPLQGCELKLPIVFGGRIQITMTDGEGRLCPGVVAVTGSAGRFAWSHETRESQNLPAGTYDLMIRKGDQTVHHSSIEVRQCEVTEVRVRLP